MAKIYVFVNQKGGVGKTTSALNIGAYLAEAGKSVLLVDFDAEALWSNHESGAYENFLQRLAVHRLRLDRLDLLQWHEATLA